MTLHRDSPTLLARIAVVLVIAISSLWFALGVTDALVMKRQPDKGLRWWSSANRQAEAAWAVAMDTRQTDLTQAADRAKAALRREPANVVAARSLAIIAARQGDEKRAESLFRYAEKLSRRDLPTQLWLIEDRVRADDIPGALTHYDRALRTSPYTDRPLIPILVSAADDLAIRRPLTAMIAARPAWWWVFAQRLVSSGKSPDTMYDLLIALKLSPTNDRERTLLAAALTRLAEMSAYGQAYRLYAQARHVPAGNGLLRNGEFEAEDVLPPFDWTLADDPDLAAVRQQRDDRSGGQALFFYSNEGRTGTVAQQLLVLAPGRYRLSAQVGEVSSEPEARPKLTMTCARPGGQTLFEADFVLFGKASSRIGVDFSVPSGCAAQTIAVVSGSSLDQKAEAWIDSIALNRV